MRRYLSSLVLLAAAVGMASCSGDPLGAQRDNPVRLVANPLSVFVPRGATTSALIQVVDSLGNALEITDFSATATSNVVSVARDSLYQPVYGASGDTLPNPHPTVVRINITGNTISTSSIVVTAQGQTDTIPVRVTPPTQAGDLAVDLQTSDWGQPITVTAPSGTRFTDSTTLKPAAGEEMTITGFNADSTQITALPSPGSSGHLTATHVVTLFNPTFTSFSVTSATDTVSTPAIDSIISVTLSSASPALGDVVTLTLPAGLRILPDSAQLLEIPGAPAAPVNITVAADSGSISFIPPPSADSIFILHGVIAGPLPQYPQPLIHSVEAIHTPAVTSFAVSASTNTPATANTPVTLTATSAIYKFDPDNTTIDVAGVPAIILGFGADSSSATILAPPSTNGTVNVTNGLVVGIALGQLPTPINMTGGPVASMAGTDDPATAPTVALPAVGAINAFFEAGNFTGADITGDGGDAAKYYRVDVPVDGTYHISTNWPNTADIDLVICADVGCASADFSQATGAQPQGQNYDLTAGTYYIAVILWTGTAPDWVTLEIQHVSDN